MTNTIALWLAGILALAILGDGLFNDFNALIFLARRLIDLSNVIAIWR